MVNSSLQGQPPHKPQELAATSSQPIENCAKCNEPSETPFLLCSKCHTKYHLSCAKVSSPQQLWTCEKCSTELQVAAPPQSTRSSHSSASYMSSNLAIRKQDLESQKLEEEKQLAKDFLNKKYQILEKNLAEIEDINSVGATSVREWLNGQADSQLQNVEQSAQNLRNVCESTNFAIPTTSVNCSNNQFTSGNNFTFAQPRQNSTQRNDSQNQTPHSLLNQMFNDNSNNVNLNNAAPTNASAPQVSFASQQRGPFVPYSSASNASINPNLTYQQANARQSVPKDLPIFTGRPEEWPLFSSTYNWSTSVCGLTDAENLIRLQKALRGDALQSVQHILVHPSCVSTAISTLGLLYGQPEKILHSLKTRIRSLPTVNPSKLETITSFAVQVKGLLATIEACNLFDELNNSCLLHELVCKMPSYFQINWGTYKMNLIKNSQKVNLLEFSNWIYDIGLSASSVNVESAVTSITEPRSRSKQRNAFVHAHTDKNKKHCFVCSGNCDKVETCQKFISADRSERWNIVRDCKLCKQCLRRHSGFCNSNVMCGIESCQLRHHSLLHKMRIDQRETSSKTESNMNTNRNNQTQNCHAHSAKLKENLFKIIPITIYGKNKTLQTFAFIDEGSSTSLIDEKIYKDLNLTGVAEPLCLKWTGNVERDESNSHRLAVDVSGLNGKRFAINVHTVKYLALPQQTMNFKEMEKNYPYLKGLPIQSYEDATPQILIGLNNSRLCVSKRVKEGKAHEPVAISTRLGWLIYGTIGGKTAQEQHHFHICDCSVENDKKLSNLVKKFYCLETSGINNAAPLMNKDDAKAVGILEKYTKQRSDGHYETSLLWRNEDVLLPNSYEMAIKRFHCLEKRLQNDNRLDEVFQKTIAEYILKGYITKIDNHNILSNNTQKVWYLPIFPVFNKNKPGKSRIVWDAAAKSNGISLNDTLLKGPDLFSSLPSIIVRFRQKAVAICGDIEQMFHQIFIRDEDRNAQRFLWRNVTSKEPEVYVMNVMIFGASCAPCISQYVKNLNASKFEEKYPLAASAIKNNHYVDDFLDSVDTAEEATRLALDVKHIHGKGGFNIRNWLSNNKNVLKFLNGQENVQQKSLDLGSEMDADKVLGVYWRSADDTITFKISSSILKSELFRGDKIPTKRELLKILMSIYDPLGLLGHYLMYLKIVLQEVWRSGIGWDDPIPASQNIKWIKWLNLLPKIQNLNIPRCYLKDFNNYNDLDVQIHTFADASENGYAAVSYFRISDGNKIIVSLVGSKTRVAPLRITSIPRLELMAALIASRFANSVVQSTTIRIHKRVFWSDSKTVISWLKSDHRRYHQFVGFRVSEILDLSDQDEWRWIPGKMNIADEATKWSRGVPDLSNDSRWVNGPDFLKQPYNLWPTGVDIDSNTDCERKQHLFKIQEIQYLVDVHRFSKWCRVLRAVAYVVKFINLLKGHSRSSESYVTQEELKQAENILIKQTQREAYLEDISMLQRNGKVCKSSSIYKLNPYLDLNGILRIDGRIDKACVPDELKHPVIMPKSSRITQLLILHFHFQYHHGNSETAINEIRQKYYVPRLRTTFKTVVRKCQMCKIRKTLPIMPQMAKLPRARLAAFVSPFTYTGLDFFGPILVAVNRHKEKRYGALFTCLTIRAVHVEIVHSLTSSSCIMAIRNFMARRGTPREIFSDNGINFVGAERELREAIKDVDKNAFILNFTTTTTKWNFNPPLAPHMGGAWERLVRSIKTVLYKIMPTRLPSDETLRSMMAEVENIINSRPLTYVPIDDENHEALTPNHLLLGSSNGMKPMSDFNDTSIVLRDSWRRSQQYAQQFWKKWLTEYLPSLTCRTKWFEKTKPLKIGDLVVVVDPISPRNVWPRGRVLETSVAEDGQVRSAKVLTNCGVLDRPVAKLAVLDVAQDLE